MNLLPKAGCRLCQFLGSLLLIALIGANAMAGDIVARGSDSTSVVVKALAEAYKAKTGTDIKVEGGGSSKGAKDCLAGEVDLAFMSRKPTDDETKAGLTAIPYALDGVAVIVNKANPIDDITLEQLKAIFTGNMKQWSDGKPILALIRPTTSGTREVFEEKVLGKGSEFDPSLPIKHDKVGIDTVSKSPTAIAFTSVGKAGELVDEIAVASNEQALGIEQVNNAVGEMDDLTQRNAANAEQSAGAAVELNVQAELMKSYVGDLVTVIEGSGKRDMNKRQRTSKFIGAKAVVESEAPVLPPRTEAKTGGKGLALNTKELPPHQVIPFGGEDLQEF